MSDNVYEAPKAQISTAYQASDAEGVTASMVAGLEKGRKWAKFLGVIAFIYAALIALGGIGLFITALVDGKAIILGVFVLGISLVGAFLVFKLGQFLFRYHRAISNLSESHHIDDLLESQEQYRRFVKWMSIIFIVFTVLAIISSVIMISMLGFMRL